MDKDFKDYLTEIAKNSYDKIEGSNIFLSLLSEDIIKDPVPVFQLGLAILLEKPIAFLAMDDVKIPDRLKSISFAVERFDSRDKESMHKATQLILDHAKKL